MYYMTKTITNLLWDKLTQQGTSLTSMFYPVCLLLASAAGVSVTGEGKINGEKKTAASCFFIAKYCIFPSPVTETPAVLASVL